MRERDGESMKIPTDFNVIVLINVVVNIVVNIVVNVVVDIVVDVVVDFKVVFVRGGFIRHGLWDSGGV